MRYRIVERVDGNGKTRFYPQYKRHLFWRSVKEFHHIGMCYITSSSIDKEVAVVACCDHLWSFHSCVERAQHIWDITSEVESRVKEKQE